MIYLDHNSTTDIRSEVLSVMVGLADYGPVNPSAIHSYGQYGKKLLEEARRSIANLLGFSSNYRKYQITFTATGTEANNLVISNFKDYEIFIAATEHLSIYEYSKYFQNITLVQVDQNGILDLDDLKIKICNSMSKTKLLSVMFANNETGVINPIKEICKLAHNYGVLVHSDCVQAIGKIDVSIEDLELDFLSISGHKFGGPMGAAALVSRTSIDLIPQIIGGGQEKSLRSGTHNVPAIVGLGVASRLVKDELPARKQHMSKLLTRFESGLIASQNSVKIAGSKVGRLPNTSLVMNSNISSAEAALIFLNNNNIAVSVGSACSSGKVDKSHVLSAMGYTKKDIESAIRVSIGATTTESDIDHFITIYNKI